MGLRGSGRAKAGVHVTIVPSLLSVMFEGAFLMMD
jgi:hypothetical protein